MIGLAINHGSFFIRCNSNAALFTPDFEFDDWNFDFCSLHNPPDLLQHYFGVLLKPGNGRLAVIGLMPAFGLGAGQDQLSRSRRLAFSSTSVQGKENWSLALQTMDAEIPP